MITCCAPSVKGGMLIRNSSVSPLRLEYLISKGGFSSVYRARSNDNIYVLKRINLKRRFYKLRSLYSKLTSPADKDILGDPKSPETLKETEEEDIEKEVNILQSAQHKYVLKLFDSFKKRGSFWLVTEFCICDMSEIKDRNSHNETHIHFEAVAHLLIPIFEAVAHMNTLGYVHLDIKTDNILISSRGVPKLADFGLAKECPKNNPVKVLHCAGTKNYMAPETVRKEFFNFSVDTWSLAVTWLYSLFGPWYLGSFSPEDFFSQLEDDKKVDQESLETKFHVPTWRDEEYGSMFGKELINHLTFIRGCLIFSWEERPTAAQMLELKFSKSILEAWEQKDQSDLFVLRNELVLSLVKGFMEKIPTEKEKGEWSMLDRRGKSISDRCSYFLGALDYISP